MNIPAANVLEQYKGMNFVTMTVAVNDQNTSVSNSQRQEAKVYIYPNPTTGSINIDMKDYTNAKTTLFDLTGEMLKSQNIESSHSNMNISDLAKGIYLLKIDTKNGSVTKRIIKE